MEHSHRGKEYEAVHNGAIALIKELYNIPENYDVLFIQGGASLQFAMIPMCFLRDGKKALYVNSGTWSKKAIKEAKIQGKNIEVIATSIAEIQQNSNVTYRLYDYGRVGKDGKTRELHIEKGVKASNCNASAPRVIPTCSDGTRLLGSCRYFAVKEISVNGETRLVADSKSYHALIVVAGEVKLECQGYSEDIVTGQTVFIPASLGAYTLSGNATVLQARHQPEYRFDGSAIVDEYGVTYGTGNSLPEAARNSGLTPADIG